MFDYGSQADALLACIDENAKKDGADFASAMIDAGGPILEWMTFLSTSKLTGNCDALVEGLRSLLLEAVACVSVALHRAAILSLRGQIDIVFSWLYFKDHPVEWDRLRRESEGAILRKDGLEYLSDNFPEFTKSFMYLRSKSKFGVSEPYKDLSAHVHALGEVAMPNFSAFKDIIGSRDASSACVEMQSRVAEYINDLLLALFGADWAALPPQITSSGKARLTSGEWAYVTRHK